MINSPSLTNCNLVHLDASLDQILRGGARFVHIDLIDGNYVQNLGFPLRLIQDIKRQYPTLITDVHAMVTDPASYVLPLKKCGADYVCFHTDSTKFIIRTLNAYRAAGIKPGLVINPSQRIDSLTPYLSYADMVVVMAVEPGFPGQQYLEGTTERIAELASLRKEMGLNFLISVDGGVDPERSAILQKLGVDVIVGTIYNIFHQPDGLEAACQRFEAQFGAASRT